MLNRVGCRTSQLFVDFGLDFAEVLNRGRAIGETDLQLFSRIGPSEPLSKVDEGLRYVACEHARHKESEARTGVIGVNDPGTLVGSSRPVNVASPSRFVAAVDAIEELLVYSLLLALLEGETVRILGRGCSGAI